MYTFILCVERYIHFPPEIYRLLATFLYYKQHWPDINIKQYNKVMKQLPYPVPANVPNTIYQIGSYIIAGGITHIANNETVWRCCKFQYDIPLRQPTTIYGRLVPWRPSIRITEYAPLCHCCYVNGVNESDFTILVNTEVSLGTWEIDFYPENERNLKWIMIGEAQGSWLEKVGDRMKQEYKDRVIYLKNPSVKQIKIFN